MREERVTERCAGCGRPIEIVVSVLEPGDPRPIDGREIVAFGCGDCARHDREGS